MQQSHAEILEPDQKVDVGKHMQHISVYTSLEPCQQCSGKFHVALVPEVIFCQRDWEIQLMQTKMYEEFRKTRSVPASQFKFPPYQELARCYYDYIGEVDTAPEMIFFRNKMKPVPAKKTMPYFLCTDDCQRICQNGHTVFQNLFSSLFEVDDVLSDVSVQNVYSTLREMQLKFGLDMNSARDWGLQTDPDNRAKISSIRNFRPALDCKHRRISQDDLECKRKKWIGARHDQYCSLQFQFDQSTSFSEKLIDQYLSPIADISSIFLPRELDGSLKGQFKIVLFNREDADKLKNELEKEYVNVIHSRRHLRITRHETEESACNFASLLQPMCIASEEEYRSELRAASALRRAVMWLERIRPLRQHEVFFPVAAQAFDPDICEQLRGELQAILPRYREDSNRKIPLSADRCIGYVLAVKSEFRARMVRKELVKCIRLDVLVPKADDCIFSLTARKDVRDTTVIKDLEFLLATSVVGSGLGRITVPQSPVDFAAPKAISYIGTSWNTCGMRGKWLDVDIDKGQFLDRKLWTVRFPEGCIVPGDAMQMGRFQTLIQNEPFAQKYVQPYSKPIFDQIWYSKSLQTRVFWSPPMLPANFFGPTVDGCAPSNGKYLICIFDIQKQVTSGNVFREFLLDWVQYCNYHDGQHVLVDAFEKFMKSQKISNLSQFRSIDLDKLSKSAKLHAAKIKATHTTQVFNHTSVDAVVDEVCELVDRMKSELDAFLKR